MRFVVLVLLSVTAVISGCSAIGSDCRADEECSGGKVCELSRCTYVEGRQRLCEDDDGCPLSDVCVGDVCEPTCRHNECAAYQVCHVRPDGGSASICQDTLDCAAPVFSTTDDGCNWTWNCDGMDYVVHASLTSPEYGGYEFTCLVDNTAMAASGSDAP